MFKISHALGIDLFNAVMSDKLKDKQLPVEFYRNRYQKETDEVFDELVILGLAVKTKWQDLPYYYVNVKGIELYKNQYHSMIEYKSPRDRDLKYLKNKINFYCDYRYYRFCDDNSDHIISAYLNYWINSYYVSHTTKDVILRFNNELRRYYKNDLLKTIIKKENQF